MATLAARPEIAGRWCTTYDRTGPKMQAVVGDVLATRAAAVVGYNGSRSKIAAALLASLSRYTTHEAPVRARCLPWRFAEEVDESGWVGSRAHHVLRPASAATTRSVPATPTALLLPASAPRARERPGGTHGPGTWSGHAHQFGRAPVLSCPPPLSRAPIRSAGQNLWIGTDLALPKDPLLSCNLRWNTFPADGDSLADPIERVWHDRTS